MGVVDLRGEESDGSNSSNDDLTGAGDAGGGLGSELGGFEFNGGFESLAAEMQTTESGVEHIERSDGSV